MRVQHPEKRAHRGKQNITAVIKKKKNKTEIASEDSTHVGSQMLTIKPSLLAHVLPEMWEEEKVPRLAAGLAAEQKRSS